MMIQQVIRAQSGDLEAFDGLVRSFQDMAVGYALGILADPEAARDVAQDAFLEAHAKLFQLSAPEAFAVWFKRIIYKHCDRRLRKREVAGRSEPVVHAPLETGLDRVASKRAVRAAVEALPEHERLVVALHYFGETPQKEVAEFLDLPLSTVKKRLHTARRRLQEDGAIQAPALRPSGDLMFTDRIAVFLALQAGDARAARLIFDRHPDWIDAPENWSETEALDGGFPLAHGRTPLLVAAARGDLEFVDYLLSKNADPDGRCGCDAFETPLFTAVLHGARDVMARLLEAGANPDLANRVGFGPLHIAYLRNQTEMRDALLAAGADPERRTHGGLRPADCVGAEIPIDPRSKRALPTGVKAIDLLSPLAPGMLVRVHGAADTGLMVLLSELAYRFRTRGLRSVWATRAAMPWQQDQLAGIISQAGLRDTTQVFTDGLEGVEECLDTDVALFVFREAGQEAEIDAVLPALARRTAVTFVIDSWLSVTRGDSKKPAFAAPYDAQIVTDPEMAARQIFPAISILDTHSNRAVSAEQAELQAAVARRVGDPQVEAFMSQPFFVVQHDTGMPGVDVLHEDVLDGFGRIVAGGVDTPASTLKYQGALPSPTC